MTRSRAPQGGLRRRLAAALVLAAAGLAGGGVAAETGFSPHDLQIVLSYGQSLAVGAGAMAPLSTRPVHPGTVMQAARDAAGEPVLSDLVAGRFEAPYISALNRMAADFARDGRTPPTLVGVMDAVSGKPLLALYLGSSDRAGSVADGLARTPPGGFFYVPAGAGGSYDAYLNANGRAVQVAKMGYEPNFFDGILRSFEEIRTIADRGGYRITDRLLFSFIQGQADRRDYGTTSYSDLLVALVARIDAAADRIFGQDITVVTVMGQTRNAYVSKQQLHFVASTRNSFLGALEFPYQAENPDAWDYLAGRKLGNNPTHLNELGYSLLGQETGDVLYGALTGTADEDDFLRIAGIRVAGNRITVRFAGLKGHLVEDDSVFGPVVGGGPPEHLGFRLVGNSRYSVVDARITGPDEVTLTVSRQVDRALTLVLGNTQFLADGSKNAFGGTPLRDSETRPADNPFGVTQMADRVIRKFVPSQAVTINARGLVTGTLETADPRARRAAPGAPSWYARR